MKGVESLDQLRRRVLLRGKQVGQSPLSLSRIPVSDTSYQTSQIRHQPNVQQHYLGARLRLAHARLHRDFDTLIFEPGGPISLYTYIYRERYIYITFISNSTTRTTRRRQTHKPINKNKNTRSTVPRCRCSCIRNRWDVCLECVCVCLKRTRPSLTIG